MFLQGPLATGQKVIDLNQKRGSLDLMQGINLLTVTVVKPWHRLSREVVEAPSPETFHMMQPDLVEDVSGYCRGVGPDDL